MSFPLMNELVRSANLYLHLYLYVTYTIKSLLNAVLFGEIYRTCIRHHTIQLQAVFPPHNRRRMNLVKKKFSPAAKLTNVITTVNCLKMSNSDYLFSILWKYRCPRDNSFSISAAIPSNRSNWMLIAKSYWNSICLVN